ncbi:MULTISPECIES: Flp1 family type IVb pilin [Paenibacillus]|uniref:Flp1 family type IVb pilin n=1 Tax=Paenibacillus TaxID=44249 RepID=UPI00036E122F|nr:Flp1 family type IVb pilin [Paenibacillus terrigena]
MLNVGKSLKAVWKEEEGLGTVEIIFIIAVLVVIVLIFKDKISELIDTLMGKTMDETDKLYQK